MISFEYFILFLVIGLVLIIDKFFSKKKEKINGELVFVSDDKKKTYFGFKKSNSLDFCISTNCSGFAPLHL